MPIKEGVTTSEVVKFFNDSFDSINGSKQDSKNTKNDLRKEVTVNTCHSTFWKEAIYCMENNVRFVDPNTKMSKDVPSLRNFKFTLDGFRKLWQELRNLNFTSFSPRNVNQDPLEIFFGMIRSHGRRNINPTCMQFEYSFKSLLINNLTSAKTVKGNCQDDEATALFSLRNFALIAQNLEESSISIDTQDSDDQYVLFNNNEFNPIDTCIEISGVLMKLYTDVRFKHCHICVSDICNSHNFHALLNEAHSTLEANIPLCCFKKEVIEKLILPLSLLLDVSFITCTEHFDSLCQAFLRLITLEYVTCWCRNINRLLKGKDSGARAQTHLAKQARIQYTKKCRIR